MTNTQSSSNATATTKDSPAVGTQSTGNIWNQDAVRICEQLKRQVTRRPSTILIGGLENSRNSATVALEVSQAMAVLTREPVLLLDADAGNSGMEELARGLLPSLEAARPIAKVLEAPAGSASAATKLQDNLFYSFFAPESVPGDQGGSFLTPSLLAQLEQCRERFPLIVLHSSAFSSQDSYALLARADFVVTVVSKGESGFSKLEQFYNNCQAITDAPVAAVLASETENAS